jgi:hypothetical protein
LFGFVFQQLGAALYTVVDKLGWYNDSSEDIAVIREPVVSVLVQLNNSKTIDRLLDLWSKRGFLTIPQDLKLAVFYTLVRYIGTEGLLEHALHSPSFEISFSTCL